MSEEEKKEEPEPSPLKVEVTNEPKKQISWNDSQDDENYEDIVLSDEEMNI